MDDAACQVLILRSSKRLLRIYGVLGVMEDFHSFNSYFLSTYYEHDRRGLCSELTSRGGERLIINKLI